MRVQSPVTGWQLISNTKQRNGLAEIAIREFERPQGIEIGNVRLQPVVADSLVNKLCRDHDHKSEDNSYVESSR